MKAFFMKKYTEDVLKAPDEELICWCAQVPVGAVRAAVREGAKTLEDIRTKTGACIGGDCKKNNPRGRCCSAELIKFLPSLDLGGAKDCPCCGKA